MATQVQGFYKV